MTITAFNFEMYWANYHIINPQPKLSTSRARILFDRCNCFGRKKKLIKGIERNKLSGLEYLKKNL